jgi:hypothetical protein
MVKVKATCKDSQMLTETKYRVLVNGTMLLTDNPIVEFDLQEADDYLRAIDSMIICTQFKKIEIEVID